MPSADTARALLAGLIAGAVGALATTAIILIAIANDERWHRHQQHPRIPLALLGVIFVNTLMLAWTALGLILGAAYLQVEAARANDGLGTPNQLFTLMIGGIVLLIMLTTGYVRGQLTKPMWATAMVAMMTFGMLLPMLAR
jgi:NADH:ubiquinone oxidoreductase subunit 6 (subunit J)